MALEIDVRAFYMRAKRLLAERPDGASSVLIMCGARDDTRPYQKTVALQVSGAERSCARHCSTQRTSKSDV